MFKFVVVLVATILVCKASVLKESCSRSGVKEGLCVKLRDCPSICKMSKDFSTPMTVERLNYLIESMCGYADMSPKVCCPVEDVMLKQEESSNSETTTSMLMREEMTNSSQMGDETTSASQMREEATTSEQTGETTTNSNEIR